jgi:hypothetical protein
VPRLRLTCSRSMDSLPTLAHVWIDVVRIQQADFG